MIIRTEERDCSLDGSTSELLKLEDMSFEEKSDENSRAPLRVLIYTPCYNVIDGVTLTIRKLELAIINDGGSVMVVTTNSGNRNNTNLVPEHSNRSLLFVDDAIPIPFTENNKSNDQRYYLGRKISNILLEQIRDFSPTLIHMTVPDITALQIIDFARQYNIPLMGTYHSNIVEYMDHYGVSFVKPFLSAFLRHCYNFMQALYVPTPYMKRYLTENGLYKLNRCTDLKVWGRGIDLEKFNPKHRSHSFRKRLNISPSDVVICFVGRLVYEKRPDIFANVIQRLHHNKVSFKAIVIGDGQYITEMKKLPNTVCLGWVNDPDELAIAYASSDIFLFPSALETFGNVTLEASASGLPIVVEAGCSGHLVENDVSGFACPSGDEDAFYNATLALIVDREMRQKFSLKSRKHSYKFEKSIILSDMIENYQRTIEEFQDKYSSSHKNRDLLWKNKECRTFDGGLIVFPVSLRVLVNCIFFCLRIGSYLLVLLRLVGYAFIPLLLLLRLVQCVWRNCTMRFRHSKLVLQQDLLHVYQDQVAVVVDIENLSKGASKSSNPSTFPTKQLNSSNRSKRNFVNRYPPNVQGEKLKRSASAEPNEMRWLTTLGEHITNFIIFNIRMQSIAQLALTSFFSSSRTAYKAKKRKNDFVSR